MYHNFTFLFLKLIDCFVNTLTSLFTAISSISDRFLAIPAPLTIEASFLVIGRVLGLRLILLLQRYKENRCKTSLLRFYLRIISNVKMLRFWKLRFHGVTQLHSYAVSFTVGKVLRRAKRAELERHFLIDIYIILFI